MARDMGWSAGAVRMVVAVLLALPLCAAGPAETFDLKQRRKAGETYTFEHAGEMRGEFTPQGGVPEVVGRHRVLESGTMTVLTVKDGVPEKVRVRFNADGHVSDADAPGRPNTPTPLAGHTITAWIDEQGRLRYDYRGEAHESAVRDQAMMFVDDDSFIRPARPVAVGDRWPMDRAGMRRYFDVREEDEHSGECRLAAVKEADGRRTAEVVGRATYTRRDPDGPPVHFTVEGSTFIDVATGQVVKGVYRGTIRFSIPADPGGEGREPGTQTVHYNWLMRATLGKEADVPK